MTNQEPREVAIVHFNTPELTEATILSLRKHGGENYHVTIFDNSDKRPFKKRMKGVKVINNTKGQILNLDEELAKFRNKCPNIGCAANMSYGSARHTMTIQKLFELIPQGFLLMDSDILLKANVDFMYQYDQIAVGHVQTGVKAGNIFRIDRLVPMLCFINVPKCKEIGINYFDPLRNWGLVTNNRRDKRNWYDTGASFLEDIRNNRKRTHGVRIDIRPLMEHFGSGSWLGNDPERHQRWLNQHRKLWASPNEKTRVALCAIGRYENRYAVEFVEHYLKLGFDKIYIYDNNREGEEHFEDVLGAYIKRGKVEIVNWRAVTENAQIKAYNDCYQAHGNEYDWLAFYDFDEFLILPDGVDIHKFMARYDDFDCLFVNWKIMDDNDLVYDDGKPVMERFTREMPPKNIAFNQHENNHIKSIVRGGFNHVNFRNPHGPHKPMRCCTPNGQPAPQKALQPYDHSIAYLKHFTTKTIDEWMRYKVQRGYPDINTKKLESRPIEMFFERNRRTPEKVAYIEQYKRNKDINIWTTYHRDELLGAAPANHTQFGVHHDANRENVNFMNPVWGELVTLWYVWHNRIKSPVVGFDHYRRILNVNAKPKKGQAVVWKLEDLGVTLYEHYARCHNAKDMDLVLDILNEQYGEGNPLCEYIRNDKRIVIGNIFAMQWNDFLALANFLFKVLDEFANRVDCHRDITRWRAKAIKDFDKDRATYQMRLVGFLGERLTTAWIMTRMKIFNP